MFYVIVFYNKELESYSARVVKDEGAAAETIIALINSGITNLNQVDVYKSNERAFPSIKLFSNGDVK